MYLKSIEVQGFKSFANKIVFEFHNGITGIVGPNGSGKSNVADAVRWVLGEQSVKQLRGSTMQDVIFAGTENRKPLSYAYVAITLDNSDHQLATPFEEVTVARRLYRSGESEYLINGNPCRLKEVSELFYDTGIGKEGYSIIGQGQIDRILSGKPEERRELFDEAAGIVKFKKRKVTTQKKLESERENLVRVNDILSELERQVGPLERASEKAKTYLKKKNELREYDINMFLLESRRIEEESKEVEQKYAIADAQLQETNASYDKIKQEYEQMEQQIAQTDMKINSLREQISNTSVVKERLENQIQILTEQIKAAEMSEEHVRSRMNSIESEKNARLEARATYDEKRQELLGKLAQIEQEKAKADENLARLQEEISVYNEGVENGQSELVELLHDNAQIQSRKQHFETMLEQFNIQKAQLSKRLLDRKTQEATLNATLETEQLTLSKVDEEITVLKTREQELLAKLKEWRFKTNENDRLLEEAQKTAIKQQSRLESLKNIAERYDGYGNSIRKIMEQKRNYPGLLGVVSDLIQVEKKYETAIETALSGNIQNIVTEDEATAKDMIRFLKENRLGRATFLPLTSVTAKKNPRNESALEDEGVIGVANKLVRCDSKYDEVVAYLLGRVLVVDHIDHAIALAKKHHYSLHIVTLEGEYLSPGGSMTGGAFKNSSNLLARNRQIEELEQKVAEVTAELKERRSRKEDILTALSLCQDEIAEVRDELQKKYLLQNTAKLSVERAKQQRDESEEVFNGLMGENQQIEEQMAEIAENRKQIEEQITRNKERESQIAEESKNFQKQIEERQEAVNAASTESSKMVIEVANMHQNLDFAQENIDRIDGEIRRLDEERAELVQTNESSKDDIETKRQNIEEIQKTILASADNHEDMEKELADQVAKKEQMSAEHRGFFQKQEEITKRQGDLDKEIFRLNNQREKLKDAGEYQTNYLWEEYELTPHAASELGSEDDTDLPALKKMIAEVRNEIRHLGDVNVNAIEEYKEVSERYTFLKNQHDDLIEAEQTLMGIIDDLDEGMRKQFAEKFADIQREFNASFQHLFGGGHGALELMEDEDILESGIRIIAQPPGKKLQNMMQMSGGEKALTAIALLFAIQALKPSPFCLLDEIEAALDDSNVTRFASYLNRLTKNTQFIVITHRRGTMTAADRLYGITMQEKGVSTLVSVNLIENDLDE